MSSDHPMLCLGKMVISVKVTDVASRQTVFVEISEQSTVRQLKCLIEGKGMGPVHRQRLAHAGKILSDDKNLEECGVLSIPSVVLSLRPMPTDTTIGAMSQAPIRPPDSPSESAQPAQFMYTQSLPTSDSEDEQEDLNVPTCRICHGMSSALGLRLQRLIITKHTRYRPKRRNRPAVLPMSVQVSWLLDEGRRLLPLTLGGQGEHALRTCKLLEPLEVGKHQPEVRHCSAPCCGGRCV